MVGDRELKHVVIYADGACTGNVGPGGFGVVLVYGKQRKEFAGGYRLTTNSRMDLLAAITGLEALRERCCVSLYSDSEYLVRGINEGWAARLCSRKQSPGSPQRVPEVDLWARLLELVGRHEVKFVHVAGGAGSRDCERSHVLAVAAACSDSLLVDDGYETIRGDGDDCLDEGRPCSHCSTPLQKCAPRRIVTPAQNYYYEFCLFCPGCGCLYIMESARRTVTKS